MDTSTGDPPYRAYFERSPLGVFVADETGAYVDANPKACELVGYSRDALLEMSVADLVAEYDADSLPPSFQELTGRGRVETELALEHADGHPIDVRIDAVSVGEDRFVAYVRDISDRKDRERRLQELKERFELAVEGANLGVWDWDMETDTAAYNDQYAEQLGYSVSELDNTLEGWESRLHPEDEARVKDVLQAHVAGETPYYEAEQRLKTADGSWKWIRDIGQVIERDETGTPTRAVGIHQDIDERKRAERALETARDRLRQIIDLVPDLIFVKNRDSEYLLANEAVAQAFGRPVEEIIGKSDYELLHSKQDPETFRTDDLEVIESGDPKTIEAEEFLTAAGERRIYDTVKIPYEQAGSEETAVLGYARDITDLKEYERTLEAQRDSLEVLNQTVRHDIRNDLQLVVAYADLLAEHVDEVGRPHLDRVQTAAKNAVQITETARTVADVVLKADAPLRPVALRSVLEGEIESVRSSHEQSVIRVDGSIPDCTVRADDLLDSAFRNLLQNAVVHSDREVPQVWVAASMDDGEVAIAVSDDGPGVPEDMKAAIFEEGVRGLESEGTGLGLYIVETLVERYGGSVDVADNEPRGAVFTVRLPVVE
ncbi:MAG: PAS domain S-box protein [Halodesulfurarchaeum sp.]